VRGARFDGYNPLIRLEFASLILATLSRKGRGQEPSFLQNARQLM
jgi:hypothetical protein